MSKIAKRVSLGVLGLLLFAIGPALLLTGGDLLSLLPYIGAIVRKVAVFTGGVAMAAVGILLMDIATDSYHWVDG